MIGTNNTKPKFVKIFYNTSISGSHNISTKKLVQIYHNSYCNFPLFEFRSFSSPPHSTQIFLNLIIIIIIRFTLFLPENNFSLNFPRQVSTETYPFFIIISDTGGKYVIQ